MYLKNQICAVYPKVEECSFKRGIVQNSSKYTKELARVTLQSMSNGLQYVC